MKQVIGLYGGVVGTLCLLIPLLGAQDVLVLCYGAIALMSLMISATFLWLWRERATPLALGMALSWAGSGLVLAGQWGRDVRFPAQSGAEIAVVLPVLSLLIAGAVLHFSVIQGSFGLSGLRFLWPVLGAFFLSFAALWLL